MFDDRAELEYHSRHTNKRSGAEEACAAASDAIPGVAPVHRAHAIRGGRWSMRAACPSLMSRALYREHGRERVGRRRSYGGKRAGFVCGRARPAPRAWRRMYRLQASTKLGNMRRTIAWRAHGDPCERTAPLRMVHNACPRGSGHALGCAGQLGKRGRSQCPAMRR